MANTILIVDDKASVRDMVKDYLTEQGFRTVTASNGKEALLVARYENPDAILLDIMMPEMDGYEFLKKFRQERTTPVLVITAKVEESDAVVGLELGADDYILKPFRMRELAARIRAALRRSDPSAPRKQPLHQGEIVLDEAMHLVTVRGEAVGLTPTEFNLLLLLMRAPGQVLTREQLADGLSDEGYSGLHRTLNVHIRHLREKVEANPDEPRYIETVFGVGYRFVSAEKANP